jgi:uncharacterized protein
MQASLFNVRVPLDNGEGVFLMNTLSDAQLVVTEPVANLLDAFERPREVADGPAFDADARAALQTLTELGFLVADRERERADLEDYFHDLREDTRQLRLTVLTTLQCNFACGYCIQGDHGDYNRTAHKMSLERAEAVAAFAESRLDALKPASLALTFFGGEPLLNLPVVYFLAERLHKAATERGVSLLINIITNGLLLTPEVVDRLLPFGLNGVKVTLDGDKAMHDRMRPLRGGQGTFDRIIANIRAVAGRCRIAIGGNFDEASAATYPALLDFLAAQDFAPHISKVAFKPVIRAPQPASPAVIPLTPVAADGKPLGGTCMTAAGSGSPLAGLPARAASACDTCHFADDTLSFLRSETRKRGFPTPDGVHMGPCEIHRRHAYTIGPDGSLYACPGFAGEQKMSTGHVDGAVRAEVADRFERLGAWRACGDCSFIPVCGGGCSVASHAERGDMNTPNCHRPSFESSLVALAAEAAR